MKGEEHFLIYLVSVGLSAGTDQDIGSYPEVDSLLTYEHLKQIFNDKMKMFKNSHMILLI